MPADEIKGHDTMRNTETLAVPCGKRNLLVVVFRAVVKTKPGGNEIGLMRFVQCDNRIHSAANEYDHPSFHTLTPTFAPGLLIPF